MKANDLAQAEALKAFEDQKRNAKKRGIEWQFTFEEWIEFWGDDLEKRGRGHDKLCMQRFGDRGPYHPLNVKKGYARENRKTAGAIQKGRNILEASRVKQTKDDWAAVHNAFFPSE